MAVILVARGTSEPKTTAELIRTLIEDPDAASRSEAARMLVAERNCSIARQVAHLGEQGGQAEARGLLLRSQYLALYRSGQAPGRTTAVRCLAEFDDEESATLVGNALGDRALRVREAAVHALPTMERSAPLVVPDLVTRGVQGDEVEAKAISRALAGIGPAAIDPLVARMADSGWVVDTLVLIGRPAALRVRQEFLRSRAGTQVGLASALLEFRATAPDVVRATTPKIVSKMMERLGRRMQPDFTAVEVLAKVGRPAVGRLVRLSRTPYLDLSGPDRNIRSSAVLVLVAIGEKDRHAVAPLLAALRRRDYDYIADLRSFYIQFGLGERELIASLQAHGDTEILLDFLTSGNRRLEAVARDYARRNGYTITGDPHSTGLYGTWKTHRLGNG